MGYVGVQASCLEVEVIVVTVKVDWGQATIQAMLPELKKHMEITL